jgi:NADH-quinone oxidoreductase subunit J
MALVTNIAFWFAAAVAVGASLLAVTRRNAVHALLWLVLSLLAVAVLFLLLGAPFAAALEVIVYAGAIMVLFLFVVMMLNMGPGTEQTEVSWLPLGVWIGPGLVALALGIDLLVAAWAGGVSASTGAAQVGPREVGAALYGSYVIAVELASVLLLAGLVAAHHLGRRPKRQPVAEER